MGKDWQTFRVKGDQLLSRVKRLIHEGNVRRVIVKQGDQSIAEFPLTVGVVGTVAAPMLAAVGALAALVTDCKIEVQRAESRRPRPGRKPAKAAKRA